MDQKTSNESYKNKLTNYQHDCPVKFSTYNKFKNFTDYIKFFAEMVEGSGLEIGAGPGGHNRKFFPHIRTFDACDKDFDVVESFEGKYNTVFIHDVGKQKLPYDNELDFIVCSCVIQHLSSQDELDFAIGQMSKALTSRGKLFLMFKVGTHDTLLTHTNSYYKEERTFRVFDPSKVKELYRKYNMNCEFKYYFVDENWLVYCCMILRNC